jgi:hypothetical protein
MYRITRKDVELAFHAWSGAVLTQAPDQHWVLDYAPTYGGYAIVSVGPSNAEFITNMPSERMPARTMYMALKLGIASARLVAKEMP